MSYGRVRHSAKKAARANDRWRHFKVNVDVKRSTYADGSYYAEACVVKSNYSRRNAKCGHGRATTPTKAVKKALSALGKGLR